MSSLTHRKRTVLGAVLALAIGTGLVSSVLAEVPTPNPLAPSPNPMFGPIPGVDITGAGPASTIHGNPAVGATKFATVCASCHGDRGAAGVANPGSDDGTVPTLNPIDPGFVEDSNGDAATFARELDAFVQHGSRPGGKSPLISMPGFGDHKLVSQADIADIEAYVMQLNGTFWPDRCPGTQLELANPDAGARIDSGKYIVQGRAADARAQAGSGIDRIVFFLDSRSSGGRFLGEVDPSATAGPSGPTSFQATLSLPSVTGARDLVAYARSTVTGQETVVSIPIVLREDPSKVFVVSPTAQSVVCTP